MTSAAADALCGLPRIYERMPLFPGYIAYTCPMCGEWHQAWDSRPLRRMIAQFPDTAIKERRAA